MFCGLGEVVDASVQEHRLPHSITERIIEMSTTTTEFEHPTYNKGNVVVKANWALIPDSMIGGLRRWIENGIPPGHFLTAVLTNDLREAVKRADDTNINRLPDYVKFLHNYAPSGCWGSVENFMRWLGHKGLNWTKVYSG
jgi:hypothetical protein